MLRNVFNRISFHADALGRYHSGLFYSDTVFPDAVLSPKTLWIDIENEKKAKLTNYDWVSPIDVLNTTTLYHETIHYLQDLATGFGCMYCFVTRDYLHHVSGVVRKLGVDKLRIPLTSWISQEINPVLKSRLANFLGTIGGHSQFIENSFSSTEFEIDPEFKYMSKLSGGKNIRKGKTYRIGTLEIIEGMAFVLTKKNVENLLAVQEEIDEDEFLRIVDYDKYDDLYQSAINVLELALFNDFAPEKLDRDFIDNLFLLIADFALLIPPPSQEVLNLVMAKELDASVFRPLNRFTAICGSIDARLISQNKNSESYTWVTEWFDVISKQKGWLTPQKTTYYWRDYLQYLHNKTPSDVTITWQLEGMKLRAKDPNFVLHWYGDPAEGNSIYKIIQSMGVAMFYRTSSGNQWRYIPKSAEIEEFQNGEIQKDKLVQVFTQKALAMTFTDHILYGIDMACPLYGWICDCHKTGDPPSNELFIKYMKEKPCYARRILEGWLNADIDSIFNYV